VQVVTSSDVASAKGGTAKPPKGAVAPSITPTLPAPTFSTDPKNINQFDVTGYIQDMTVNSTNVSCPDVTDPSRFGGTVMLNGATLTVPCNMIIQMPANTMTWAEFVNPPAYQPQLPVTLKQSASPVFELRAVGNIVAGQHVAGLMFASQQSANTGGGYIKSIDYSTGNLIVDGGKDVTGKPNSDVVIQINDPEGRFGRAQSPDPRLSVDGENPTIHSGTGYPMCVPRSDPSLSGGDDPLCPQQNRPKPVTNHCRNFTDAGVIPLPAAGELSAPLAGQTYCTQYVMPAPPTGTNKTTGPDSRQQVPFEVADYINWSGTLVQTGSGSYISAHTIEANVGVFTQPGSVPTYLAIGDFGVGTADPLAAAASGVAQETQDRIFLEAETTDVNHRVDIYLQDVDPTTGKLTNRWVTPFAMTGDNFSATNPSGGGILTQFTGPQESRARLRATKAPTGLLSNPSRTLRVASRSQCPDPTKVNFVGPNGKTCLESTQAANGLFTGQYTAPVFEFIFPEGVHVGDTIVPNDFWHLGFLRYGEGPGTGPLEPAPW
jgi:hypothetical protein